MTDALKEMAAQCGFLVPSRYDDGEETISIDLTKVEAFASLVEEATKQRHTDALDDLLVGAKGAFADGIAHAIMALSDQPRLYSAPGNTENKPE